jgi:murein DD-endopeptidase MepM/ murein hydrolase activator NlpD
MVRYIGADKQGSANSALRTPEVNTLQPLKQSDQSFQFASQQYQQTGEQLKNSLQFQSQTAARMSEDFSRTNQSAVQSSISSLESQSKNNGLSQALGNLAQVGNMIVGTLDSRAKQEAAQAKAVREANAATMWERVSQWEVDAPAKARLDPAGTVRLRTEAQELFNSTEGGDLLPEDRQAIMKHVYGGVIAGIASKNTEDLVKKMGNVQDVNRNLKKERAIFESSKLLSDLGAATTFEEQNVSVSKLSQFLGSIATSRELDPLDKAEIQLGLTVVMNKSMTTSEDNRQKIQSTLESYQKFQNDVLKAREAHPGDVEAQEAAIAASAWINNIPHPLADKYNPTSAQERAIQRVKLNNTERDLRDDQVSRELGVAGLVDEAGYDAELFPTEADLQVFASQLGNGNAEVGSKTPRFKQVVAAQKARNEFREAQASYNVKISQLTQQKSRIAQGDAAANLAYIKTLKPGSETDNLIKRLQIVAGNNPAMQSFLPLIGQYDALDQQKKAAFDNAFSQATQQGFNASAELTAAIDMEAGAVRNQLVLKQNEMLRYGFSSDGTFSPKRAKEIEKRVADREAARAARRAAEREQGGQGGATEPAPFSSGTQYFNALGTLHTQMSPTGELILPITKEALRNQGPGNVNSPVGPRWGREHNGQDYGVDPKTSIVAQMDGVVTEVNYQESGAGHYVRVKYPDGSTHTQMHLYQAPNLAVGQRVKAGQVIGLAGNTGMPGGNSNPGNTHLHWEVWYGDERSTPQIWSARYRKSLEAQKANPTPRGRGPGSSVTSPTRGVPGVPIKGGVLIPNGTGGASRVNYNPTTQSPQALRQQMDIPTPAKVDKSKAGQVLMQRTGKKNTQGLEDLLVTVYDRNGKQSGIYTVNSGAPNTQGMFGPMGSTTAGVNAPIEYGDYPIGQGEAAYDIPGMRSQFIPLATNPSKTDRSLLGIHFDGDRAVNPGSAGCIVFGNKSDFDKFHAMIKQNDNRNLQFSSQVLQDSGQQKQRSTSSVPSPTSAGTNSVTSPTSKQVDDSSGGQVFTTSDGSRFTRNGGKVQFLPRTQGSSGNVTSSPSPYTSTNPLRNLSNSNRPSDYNLNDLDNNHGFAPLKRNPRVARTLNEVAKSFGVPGEWLAEVISVETDNTFDPNQKERGGSGATGLIQFFPDVDGGSTKTINGKVYNLDTIGAMSMEQQLRGPVSDYLREAMKSNGMKRIPTIQDLYSLVWAYGPKEKAVKMRDIRGPSGSEILKRLGKFSGRRYSSLNEGNNTTRNIATDDGYSSPRTDRLTTPIDRTHVASCATCQLMASNDMFVPHERQSLNKGMELFNIA